MARKITLVVESDDEMTALYEAYQGICGATYVRDAGLTVFTEPTLTCIGIGPIPPELVGDDLRCLKTLT